MTILSSNSSERSRSRAGSAATTDSAAAWNQSALLRVWGYVTERESPIRGRQTVRDTEYQVHIQSHDDAEEVDLLQPHWYATRQPVHRPRADPAQILRRTNFRLDKFSDYADGEITVRVLDCELEPGRWGPICFCLCKRIHVPSDKSNYFWDVPVFAITGAFASYLDRLRGPGTGAAPSFGPSPVAIGRARDGDDTSRSRYELETGRRRRRARRHGGGGGRSAGAKMESSHNTIASPSISVTADIAVHQRSPSPVPGHPLLLGRRRRRQKRLKLDATSVTAPLTPFRKGEPAPGDEAARIRPAKASSASGGVTGMRDLLAQTKEPVLLLEKHFADVPEPHLLAVPIHHDVHRQLLGYVILPKYMVPLPSEGGFINNIGSGVTRLTFLAIAMEDRMPQSYWVKFLLQTFYELLDALDVACLCPSKVSGFKLVLKVALMSPSLSFPESPLMPSTNTATQYRTSSAREYRESDWERPLNRGVGTDTARFLGWMSGMWRQRRLEVMKRLAGQRATVRDVPYRGWSEETGRHPIPPNLPADGAVVDDEQFIEVEYAFALCLRKMERQAAEGATSAPDTRQKRIRYPRLLENPDKHREVDYLPRDLFYGSRYFGLIPPVYQEQIIQHIWHIAADPNQPASLRAHAALQFGIGLLSGFGLDQDIDRGFEWVFKAAQAGSRKAHAIVRRLHRAYGSELPAGPEMAARLAREARNGSPWALEELRDDHKELYEATAREAVTQHNVAADARRRELEEVVASRFRAASTPREYERDGDRLNRFSARGPGRTTSAWNAVREVESGVGDQSLRHSSVEGSETDFSDGDGHRSLPPPRSWRTREPRKPSRADRVRQFLARLYNIAVRCMCRGSLHALHRRRKDVEVGGIGRQIGLALAAGQGEVALALLGGAEKINRDSAPYLLFQLHRLRPEHVTPITRAIVEQGFDVNEKVDLRDGKIFKRNWLSVFGDTRPGGETWTLGIEGPEPGDYFRHWSPELRGQSLTPLRWAIFHNNEHVVRVLLALGAEFPRIPDAAACAAYPSQWVELPPEAFTVAVLDEPTLNKEILKMFFERHGSQLGKVVFAETPLGLIAMEPNSPEWRLRFLGRRGAREQFEDVLSLLRKHQPDSDVRLFWAAAMNGHVDIIRHLVTMGVSIEIRHNGLTPLHTAVLHGQRGAFEVLLQNGADVHALTSNRGMSTMHLLFWKPKPTSTELFMLNELHRLLADVEGGGGEFGRKVRPIHLAALNLRVDGVQRLMELGADEGVPIGENIMASIRGCRRNREWKAEVLDDLLLAEDSNPVHSTSIEGLTPVGIVVARSGTVPPSTVRAMLQALLFPPTEKAESPPPLSRLYTRPDKEQTVLHLLATRPTIVEAGLLDFVLERFVTPTRSAADLLNVGDADGDTPLHYAALFAGNDSGTSAVDRLLALGAYPRPRNLFGVTPGTIRACALVAREMRQAGEGLSPSGDGGGKPRERTVRVWFPSAEDKERSQRSRAGEAEENKQGTGERGPERSNSNAMPWSLGLRDESEPAEIGSAAAIITQLLEGAAVKEMLDLETGHTVPLEGEARAQMSTVLDAVAVTYRRVE